MDAREFFHIIVKPNYYDFEQRRDDLRLLWNALVSMSTVPEYLALDQLEYRFPLRREEIEQEARAIRDAYRSLAELKDCAEAFKHVRKITRQRGGIQITVTTTAVDPYDRATWEIDGKNLVSVVHSAFTTLSNHPNLKLDDVGPFGLR